jgi:hypothetical protein
MEQVTKQEFGRLIKQKFPEYQGVDDVQLANRIIEKYPQYRQRISTKVPKEQEEALERDKVKLTREAEEREQRFEESGDKGFFGSLAESAKSRFGQVRESFKRGAITGDLTAQTPVETGLQTVGAGIGFLGDAIAETVIRGAKLTGKALSAVTPDFIEDPVKGTLSEAGKKILENETVKAGLKKADEGIDSYFKWKQENPRAAANVESVVNIGLVLSDAKAFQAVAPKGGALRSAGEAIEAGVEKQGLDETIKIISPKVTTKRAEQAITKGNVVESGLLRTRSIVPDRKLREVAEDVNEFVKKGDSPIKNRTSIGNAIQEVEEGIQNQVITDNKAVDKEALKSVLEASKEQSKVVFAGDTALENNYNAVIDEFIRIFDTQSSDVEGVLAARREFDKVIKKKFPNIFDKFDSDVIRTNAVKDVRQAGNNFVASQLDEGDEFLEALGKQTNMFRAIDNIAETSAPTINTNAITRAVDKFKKIPVSTSILAAGGLSVGALTGILTSPIVLTALIGGGSIVIGKKVITAKVLRNILSEVLKKSGDALEQVDKDTIKLIIDSLIISQEE